MSSTQVIFKPGGVVALVVVSAAVMTAIVVGMGKGDAAKPTAIAATPASVATPPATTDLTALNDELRLATLNKDAAQSRNWLFLGPLPSGTTIPDGARTDENAAQMRHIMSTSYLPAESKYKARENQDITVKDATYRWRKLQGSAFNFQAVYQSKEAPSGTQNNVVVYGYTTIESKGAARKNLHFRSDDGAIIWINGQQVYMGDKIRGVDDEDIIPIELRPGQNNVLVKVGQGSNGWGMAFQLEDQPGK